MIVARDTWHYVHLERLTSIQLLSRPKPGLYYIRLYDHDQSGTLPQGGTVTYLTDRQLTGVCFSLESTSSSVLHDNSERFKGCGQNPSLMSVRNKVLPRSHWTGASSPATVNQKQRF
jgi:hypothetical protein